MQSRTLTAECAANPISLLSHCLLIKQQLKKNSGSEQERAGILVLEPYSWFICEIEVFLAMNVTKG